MKKIISTTLILSIPLILTACGDSEKTTKLEISSNPPEKISEIQKTETLNDKMLVFQDLMEKYLANGKKDLKALEKLHLSFVPILGWKEYEGNEVYKTAALSVGQVVHKLEDLEGVDYDNLLATLKPNYIKFHAEFGEK